MADTNTNLKAPANTAVGPQKPITSTVQQNVQAQKPALKLDFHRSKFEGIKLAKLRLLKPGIIQYDPQYPELVLNTDSSEGKILPLTSFFSGRLGKTIELISIVEE